MTERISREQIEKIAVLVACAAKEVGVLANDDVLNVDHGSKVNGISFSLSILNEDKGRSNPNGLPKFLGWTRREAYNTLRTVFATLEAVRYAQAC